MQRKFKLPDDIAHLVDARNLLRCRYHEYNLAFTFDGKLVGDLGEAIAAEIFGLHLDQQEAFDAYAEDKRTVQIKATGRRLGPAFRRLKSHADHLIFLDIDFENGSVEVIFNGPEYIALSKFPVGWEGQRALTPNQIREADQLVKESDRLLPMAN